MNNLCKHHKTLTFPTHEENKSLENIEKLPLRQTLNIPLILCKTSEHMLTDTHLYQKTITNNRRVSMFSTNVRSILNSV